MRILLTIQALTVLGGAELYVLDVCRELVRRGYQPCVYAPRLGALAEVFRANLISVFDDLERMQTSPDVIHGNYGLSTFAAAMRFETAPIVHVCHGWEWRGDMPLGVRRVRHFVAVDTTSRERLLCQHGLPPDRVRVIFNGVDGDRFPRRDPLPEQPKRALVFSNYMKPADIEPLQAASRQMGIHLDVVGRNLGQECSQPEEILGKYDVVFAKGRCAWEALVTGCAVIVADHAGLGPLVTSSKLQQQRDANFGRRLMVDPLTAGAIQERLAAYDANDAVSVTGVLRAENTLAKTVDQLLALYEETIEQHRLDLDPNPESDQIAIARFAEEVCHELTAEWPAPPAKSRTLKARLQRLAVKVRRIWSDDSK